MLLASTILALCINTHPASCRKADKRAGFSCQADQSDRAGGRKSLA